eukprot:4915640-Amphidinium_carterae.1
MAGTAREATLLLIADLDLHISQKRIANVYTASHKEDVCNASVGSHSNNDCGNEILPSHFDLESLVFGRLSQRRAFSRLAMAQSSKKNHKQCLGSQMTKVIALYWGWDAEIGHDHWPHLKATRSLIDGCDDDDDDDDDDDLVQEGRGGKRFSTRAQFLGCYLFAVAPLRFGGGGMDSEALRRALEDRVAFPGPRIRPPWEANPWLARAVLGVNP